MASEIKYCTYDKIDIEKWNTSINKSINGIVYAYSWYLDIVSPNWDALIMGDYEAVMPITYYKKLGSNFFAQPLYTQQLGIFSTKKLSSDIIDKFISAIPKKYKYININLNKFNAYNSKTYNIDKKITYEIELIQPYTKLYNNYSTNTKRNLKKAAKYGLEISKTITPNNLQYLYHQREV